MGRERAPRRETARGSLRLWLKKAGDAFLAAMMLPDDFDDGDEEPDTESEEEL